MAGKPAFLIVGAMKAGTTTLFRDMQHHPDIFLPELKEPETLVKPISREAMRAEYATIFRHARSTVISGEASTAYTKRPDHEGAAAAALDICGPELRILYMRRDPVDRILSQYKHERQFGGVGESIDQTVRSQPRFIDYSRYDWQIAPWIETFGKDSVLQLEMEEFARDRRGHVERALAFVGADPSLLPPFDETSIANSSADTKFIGNPVLRRFIYSDLYQLQLKSLIPKSLRENARRTILPDPSQDAEIETATVDFIRRALAQPRQAD